MPTFDAVTLLPITATTAFATALPGTAHPLPPWLDILLLPWPHLRLLPWLYLLPLTWPHPASTAVKSTYFCHNCVIISTSVASMTGASAAVGLQLDPHPLPSPCSQLLQGQHTHGYCPQPSRPQPSYNPIASMAVPMRCTHLSGSDAHSRTVPLWLARSLLTFDPLPQPSGVVADPWTPCSYSRPQRG